MNNKIKFDKKQFDKYGFKYPEHSDFKDNGYPFTVLEVILTDVVGSWDNIVTTECVLGMVVCTDFRTKSPESLFWSIKTGNCGNNFFSLTKNKGDIE